MRSAPSWPARRALRAGSALLDLAPGRSPQVLRPAAQPERISRLSRPGVLPDGADLQRQRARQGRLGRIAAPLAAVPQAVDPRGAEGGPPSRRAPPDRDPEVIFRETS